MKISTVLEGTTNLGGTSMNYSNKNNGSTVACNAWGGDAGTCTFYHSGGYNNYPYKVYHKTATGTGGIYYKTANDIAIEAGKTYTMSVYIKASVNINNASAYSFNINRGSDNYYINYGTSFSITTNWKRLVKTFTATSSQAGLYGEMSIIYDDAVTDYYIYYSGFQIEEKDHATSYVNGTRANNTIIAAKPKIALEGATDSNKIITKCQIPGFIYGYNQLFYPTTTGNWIGNTANITFSNNMLTAISTGTANYWGIQHVSSKSVAFYKTHKYYFSAECYPDTVAGNGSNTGLNLYSTGSGYVYQQSQAIPEKTWTRIESIFTVNRDSSGTIYPWIFANQRSDRAVGDKVIIKNVMLIDLTEWYGAGNEPTSTSMFSNTFPNSIYPVQQTVIKLLIDKINKL